MAADEIGPVPTGAVAGAPDSELPSTLEWFNELIRIIQRDATAADRGRVLQATVLADLNQTITGPSVAEVQAISDKVDALLALMRTAGQLDT